VLINKIFLKEISIEPTNSKINKFYFCIAFLLLYNLCFSFKIS
jgi:hypothetical protein